MSDDQQRASGTTTPGRWTRRTFLAAGAAAVVTACSSGGSDAGEDAGPKPSSTDGTASTTVGAGGTGPTAPPTAGADGAPFTVADFEGLGACRLTPEQTPGPFPLDEQLDRREITEGKPGQPLRLGFRVLDEGCRPVDGARVEVWHTDATGDYSAFIDDGGGKDEGQGTTFLRGTQPVDGDGIADFLTIYPGWYTGRAVHVHVRVHVAGDLVLTTQAYFDEAETERTYRTGEYEPFGPPDTTWADDGIAGDPVADGTAFALATQADTTIALLNLTVPAV